jgi:hypothetical protein
MSIAIRDYSHTCDLTRDDLTYMPVDDITEHAIRHAQRQGKELPYEVAALLRVLDVARAERDRLAEQVQQVRDLHSPDGGVS